MATTSHGSGRSSAAPRLISEWFRRRCRPLPWILGASLLAFIVVYFIVFGAGVFYILRIVSKPPEGEQPELREGPTRTAGITPVQQVEAEGGHA